MTKENRKVRNFKMKWILYAFLLIFVLYFMIQAVRCNLGLDQAREKLSSYEVKTAELSYGAMTYIDEGEGEVVLSVHGLFGGYDQAYENVRSRIGKTACWRLRALVTSARLLWGGTERPRNKRLPM